MVKAWLKPGTLNLWTGITAGEVWVQIPQLSGHSFSVGVSTNGSTNTLEEPPKHRHTNQAGRTALRASRNIRGLRKVRLSVLARQSLHPIMELIVPKVNSTETRGVQPADALHLIPQRDAKACWCQLRDSQLQSGNQSLQQG